MRAVAVSVWLFLNLVFLGMGGYMYLLWCQYWQYVQRQKQLQISLPTQPAYPYDVQYLDLVVQHDQGGEVQQDTGRHHHRHLANHSSSAVGGVGGVHTRNSRPRLQPQPKREEPSGPSKCRPEVEHCDGEEDSNLQRQRLAPSVAAHKSQLVVQLRRVLIDESSIFAKDRNVYGVHYSGPRGSYANKQPRDLICGLRRAVKIRSLSGRDEPFARLGLGHRFPASELFIKHVERRRHFRSCAVVSSAASLKGSRLGDFIDSHDAVVRFNHAPTEGHEEDAGHKTTLRIVNSQVVSKPEFEFATSPLYRNISLLAWDPCNYTRSLEEWYTRPDFDLFEPYFRRRELRPEEPLYLLDPRVAWAAWDFLQANVPARLRRNPPSSGFLGLALMLPVCSHVDLIEFVPSLRLSKRCHYFDVAEDSGCTFGSWHPLAAEKLLALAMTSSEDGDVFGRGVLRVPGYTATGC